MSSKQLGAGAVLLLVLLVGPQAAQGQVACQAGTAPAGAVYICDSLNGTTVATQRNGGDLTQDGFVVHGNNDSLVYDWGMQISEFCLEFDVSGIDGDWSVLNKDNYHILDMLEGETLDFNHCGLSLRIYGCDPATAPEYCNPPDVDPSGTVKLKNWCPAGNDEPFTKQDIGWDPNHWYHMRVVSQNGTTTWFRDGAQVVRPANSGAYQPHYGRVWLPNDGWPAYFTIPGSIYRNFMISSDPGCSIPQCGQTCDDGNPCTVNDTLPCPGGACAGTPVADGTVCDDGDPQTSDTTCRRGVCAADCDLPDPKGIVVAADHTVSVFSPDQSTADETTLDVEQSDTTGDIEAVSYLKFQIQLQPGETISSASIHLYCDLLSAPKAAEGNGGDIHLVRDNSWTEGAITWNNKPAWDNQVIFSQGHIDLGSWYAFDVSTAVIGEGVYSFAILPNASNGGHYLSKEGGEIGCKQPYLVLTTQPDPGHDGGGLDGAAEDVPDSGVAQDSGSPGDSGAGGDAGVKVDSGIDEDAGVSTDAQPPVDSGKPAADAGESDYGIGCGCSTIRM